jgi:hypothetical protein
MKYPSANSYYLRGKDQTQVAKSKQEAMNLTKTILKKLSRDMWPCPFRDIEK